MQAGKLNQQISIQRKGGAEDALGQVIPGWETFAVVWASIRHPSGLATIRADAQASVVKASIRIRYRTDLQAGMRVVHSAHVYTVKAVVPDLVRREHVDLVCEVT